jgi:hypothetical protein
VTDDPNLLILDPVAPPAPAAGRRRPRVRRAMAALATVVAAAATLATVTGGDHDDHTAIDDEVPPAPRRPAVAVAPAPGGGVAEAAAPARPPPGPVVEELPLRADGGLGPFTAGAGREEVVALASAILGTPGTAPEPQQAACAADAALTVTQETEWDDLVLTFAGTGEDDLHLVGWEALARRDAPRRFRLAGGPAIGDPMTAWQAAYGPVLEVHDRLAGDGGQSRITVHLAEGDVALFGGARASAFAYLARGGATCAARAGGGR